MKTRKALFAGLLTAILLGSVPGNAFGQGQTWLGQSLEQRINSAWGRSGILRYNAALQIGNTGYDSDIYFGTFAQPVPDFILAIGPDLQMFLSAKKWLVFEIADSPRYVFFAKTVPERTLNNSFNGNLHMIFNKVYVEGGASLINAKERLNSELGLNVRLKTDDYSGLFLWQATKETSFMLQYQRTRYNYEDLISGATNISANLDRTEKFVRLLGYLQQKSRIRFYLKGEYGTYAFADSVSSYKDTRSYGLYAGADFVPPAGGTDSETSGVRGGFNLGYQKFDIIDPSQQDYSGLGGNVSVSLGILKRTAFRLFFSKGPRFSVYSGLTYYLGTDYGIGLSRSLSRHVVFTYDFSYSLSDYPSAEPSSGAANTSNIQYWTHAFRLTFLLRKDLELSLLADLGRRSQPSAVRPVSDRAFVGFGLTYGYSGGGFSLPTGPQL